MRSNIFSRVLGLCAVVAFAAMILAFFATSRRTVVQARAQDDEIVTSCRLATISGNYGYHDSGSGPAGEFTDVGVLEFNGAGKVTVVDTGHQGDTTPELTGTGSYMLNANCTGTMKVTYRETGGASVSRTNAFVVVSNAGEIDLMSTTPNIVATQVAKRVD